MRIIYSAYFCNPYWPSESMSAFRWLTILVERYDVVLFTSEASAEGIFKYYHQTLPQRLKILTFKDDNILKRKFKVQLHFGYFTFNNNVRKYITKNEKEFDDVKLIIHKNPTSFRYFTYLYKLNKPLVVGPISGGLQVPEELKDYFKSESVLNKLRVLDQWVLRLPMYQKELKKADKLLITLDYLSDLLPKKYAGKMFPLFETGISIENDFIERAATTTRTINILWAGKLVRYKGAELLVRAADKIKEKNFHVDIVGDGVEQPHIERLVTELKLEKHVTVHGNVPFVKMEEFYKNADIFCFPSITEAVGNVFLEAMKYGLPIIAINNGGPKYICTDGGTFKIPVSSIDTIVSQIADKLVVLIDSPELRIKMGRANYNHCKSNYTWNSLSQNIYELVETYR